MANKKGSTQLRYPDRIRLEALLLAGHSVTEISVMLKRHRSTIYKEIKRGVYIHRNSDQSEEERYSADLAQTKFEEGLRVRGTQLKIGNDIELANYIEEKIVDEGYSPDAVVGELKVSGAWKQFNVTICTHTIYNYIDKGIFLRLTNEDLPVKRNKKRKYKKIRKKQKRAEVGESIDNRPDIINKREEFGHWEMDSIIGQRGRSKNTLLTLTERKTRKEIIFKQEDHSAEAVVKALDRLEREWGSEMFRKVFKTITVDNGTEFSYCKEMEKSVFSGERTKIYYCHPYSSWERGTNEVTNRMVRRKVPKGSNFDAKTQKDITKVEEWMNAYPRQIHGYRTAGELFDEEIRKLKGA